MSNRGKTEEEKVFNSIVGKNIRYLRKERKLTQSDIGKAINVSFQQVQKYENGFNGLHARNLYNIAHKVFNINCDVICDPLMIAQREGFKDKHESQEYQTLGNAKTPQDAGYLKPQKDIGSLEEIDKWL